MFVVQTKEFINIKRAVNTIVIVSFIKKNDEVMVDCLKKKNQYST